MGAEHPQNIKDPSLWVTTEMSDGPCMREGDAFKNVCHSVQGGEGAPAPLAR